jgi:hypothetical protein
VTDADVMHSLAPKLFAQIVYDFGARPNAYVLAEIEGQAPLTSDGWPWTPGAAPWPWGPTVEAGLRF